MIESKAAGDEQSPMDNIALNQRGDSTQAKDQLIDEQNKYYLSSIQEIRSKLGCRNNNFVEPFSTETVGFNQPS